MAIKKVADTEETDARTEVPVQHYPEAPKLVGKCPTCGRDHANTGTVDAEGRPIVKESADEDVKDSKKK